MAFPVGHVVPFEAPWDPRRRTPLQASRCARRVLCRACHREGGCAASRYFRGRCSQRQPTRAIPTTRGSHVDAQKHYVGYFQKISQSFETWARHTSPNGKSPRSCRHIFSTKYLSASMTLLLRQNIDCYVMSVIRREFNPVLQQLESCRLTFTRRCCCYFATDPH
jgi:hypothetical protein